MEKKINIAIDGYSACGKSSTAKIVAQKLGYLFVDSGAMYRAVTYYFIKNKIDIKDSASVNAALEKIKIEFRQIGEGNQKCTFLNGENVEEAIRSLEVSNLVSEVSTLSAVRSALVAQQQEMGKTKGLVMDGRDIGTVVFPDAELKIFMTANYDIRAIRREKELAKKGKKESIPAILSNLKKRDHIDFTREDSPLSKAIDALEMDTSEMTLELQGETIYQMALDIINK